MLKLKIPATSANIGSGFDSLGLALTLYNYIYMEEYDGLLIESLDSVAVPKDESNLVFRSAKNLFESCGKSLKGLHIKQENNIPFSRGLGSSSACIVGGLLGANELLGRPFERGELLNIAATIEGHPDNVAPALLGGLVTSVLQDGKVYSVKQRISGELRFVALIPDSKLKTETARAVLPKTIAHRDAVFNLSRAALMSVSLYSGNYQNLRIAAADRLHQPYRMPLIGGAEEVMDFCNKSGAYASYISGAGSTIMAIIDGADTTFADKAVEFLNNSGLKEWQVKVLSIDNDGAVLSAV